MKNIELSAVRRPTGGTTCHIDGAIQTILSCRRPDRLNWVVWYKIRIKPQYAYTLEPFLPHRSIWRVSHLVSMGSFSRHPSFPLPFIFIFRLLPPGIDNFVPARVSLDSRYARKGYTGLCKKVQLSYIDPAQAGHAGLVLNKPVTFYAQSMLYKLFLVASKIFLTTADSYYPLSNPRAKRVGWGIEMAIRLGDILPIQKSRL